MRAVAQRRPTPAAVSRLSTPGGEIVRVGCRLRPLARTLSQFAIDSSMSNACRKPSQGTRLPVRPQGLAHPEDTIVPADAQPVPSPGDRVRLGDNLPRPTVAARRPRSPRQLTRSETHACQEWSMTDLNSFTNQPKSRCVLPDSRCRLPIKTLQQPNAPSMAMHAAAARLGPIGPDQRSAAAAENSPSNAASRDE